MNEVSATSPTMSGDCGYKLRFAAATSNIEKRRDAQLANTAEATFSDDKEKSSVAKRERVQGKVKRLYLVATVGRDHRR